MAGRVCFVSPSPLIPLPSRERGNNGGCIGLVVCPAVPTLWIPAYAGMTVSSCFCLAVTLTFDSSPIKGEGDSVGLSCSPVSPCRPVDCADQVRNDGMRRTPASPSFPRRRESTGWSDGTVLLSPLPLILLPSRERG